uniref:O-methyltransferase C-terminal domain-containing protein n=1 Tax=Quercus lobata TaxID=97700 RepID=A0A7N2MCP7_QUELO
MPTNNPDVAMMLDRIPKMMASHSVVANEFGSFQRLYTLSPVSKHFVRNEDGVSLAPMIALPHDKHIIKSYKGFEQLRQLVDVGGSLGVNLNLITSKYPHIKGINFDLHHVIQHAPPYPVYILHDWDDEHCLKLLKNCYNATPHDGKVIVVEAVLPITPKISSSTKSTSQMDLIMMTQTPAGKERTQQEFMALATKVGFSGIRYECFICNVCVMEFFK